MQSQVFQDILNYDWESDARFQEGLKSILSSLPPGTEPSEELLDRAKCFFWGKRTSQQVEFEEYVAFKSNPSEAAGPKSQPNPQQSSGEQPMDQASHPSHVQAAESGTDGKNPAYPQSFADIVELINSGKPIPGIRDIPNKLNEAPPSQPTQEKRRKPWEKD